MIFLVLCVTDLNFRKLLLSLKNAPMNLFVCYHTIWMEDLQEAMKKVIFSGRLSPYSLCTWEAVVSKPISNQSATILKIIVYRFLQIRGIRRLNYTTVSNVISFCYIYIIRLYFLIIGQNRLNYYFCWDILRNMMQMLIWEVASIM